MSMIQCLRDDVAMHLQDLIEAQVQLYAIFLHSLADLFLQLTATAFGSLGQRIVPLTDALTEVKLIAFHSCWLRFERPDQLALHMVEVAVHTHSSCPRLY